MWICVQISRKTNHFQNKDFQLFNFLALQNGHDLSNFLQNVERRANIFEEEKLLLEPF